MNKEQATIYVIKSLDEKTILLEFQYKFLLLNLVLFGISLALYHELLFIIISSFIIILNAVFTIVFAKRNPNFFKVTILSAIQLIVFCIALNFIVFGMYKLVELFVLWEFIISIVIQLIAFVISFVFVKKHAENFKFKKNVSKMEILAGAIAGFCCSLTLLLCHIFTPSLSAIITPIALLINILVCLMGVGVTAAIYRAYLIKKYKIILTNRKEIEYEKN